MEKSISRKTNNAGEERMRIRKDWKKKVKDDLAASP